MENEIKDIISSKENIFQNTRLLTMEEISNFRKDMKLKNFDSDLLPIFDFFDNDFICYQAKNKKWCIFNAVDEIVFKKDSLLEDLLKLKS